MTLLAVLIPPRPRAAPAGEGAAATFGWVWSSDGETVARQGQGRGAELPRAQQVVAVLPDAEVAWHRITLPKAPAAKQRAALAGVLEEQLLDDDNELHLALEPQAAAGKPVWVAVIDKGWLAGVIAELERAGVPVDRVVPSSWPAAPGSAHFFVGVPGEEQTPWLVISGDDGVAVVSTAGTLARQRLASAAGGGLRRFTAQPAVAAAAERWLEAPVHLCTDAERALAAAASPWNLRQFDLVARHRGTLLARDAWRRFLAPGWRPVRLGLAALLAVHIVGLNAWAWQLERAAAEKHAAMTALLREAHPQVRAVLDAPAQMRRETELLRERAGRAGDGDLEPLLAAAAAAWPEGAPPVPGLRFEPGVLTLETGGLAEPQLAAASERLRGSGLLVEAAPGTLAIRRAR